MSDNRNGTADEHWSEDGRVWRENIGDLLGADGRTMSASRFRPRTSIGKRAATTITRVIGRRPALKSETPEDDVL